MLKFNPRKYGLMSSKNKTQSLLAIGKTMERTTCPSCRMSYYIHIKQDSMLHTKYHAQYMSGLKWPDSLTTKQVMEFIVSDTDKRKKKLLSLARVVITVVDKLVRKQVDKCRQLLDMVNQELDSPKESEEWMRPESESSKAFVAVINQRAVGVVCTDTIESGSWMLYKTKRVVPDQVNKHSRVGISRIWVLPKWRRCGFGERLLQCVCRYSLYGVTYKPQQIAFSQPSGMGGELAKKFCGVRHKSGEILIPVYQESEREKGENEQKG